MRRSAHCRRRSNHADSEAQTSTRLGDRLPARRVRHFDDSRPSHHPYQRSFRAALVRRIQPRRRVHQVLLPLVQRHDKGRHSPHCVVRFLLHFGHFLHLFSQQRKARTHSRRHRPFVHSRLVRCAKRHRHPRHFRCVRRARFPCRIHALIRVCVLHHARQPLGHRRSERSAYNSHTRAVFLLHAACHHSEILRVDIPAARFSRQSLAFLQRIRVFARRFVYDDTLHRILLRRRADRRAFLL